VSPPEAARFAGFLAARPTRRGRAVLLSVLAHAGALAAFATVRAERATPPAPPLLVRLMQPALRREPPRSRAAEAAPVQARRPRLRPRALVQPPPSPPAEPPPVEEIVGDDPPQEEEAPAAGPAPATAVASLDQPGKNAVLELRDVARPPAVLEQVAPEYAREARWSRIEGVVVIRVIIGTDGRVERGSCQIVRSVPALDGAARAAIERWRFSPALDRTGRPVRVFVEVPFRFSLR
jgi:protein TonB